MHPKPYNLAIETTSQPGSVSLGRCDQLIDTLNLSDATRANPQDNRQRRGLDLMPAIDQLLGRHNVGPTDLGEVYLSIGPGSFTGLRVAVATAKSLAHVLGVQITAVPTLHVVAHNAPTATPDGQPLKHLAVCLNQKRDTVYAQAFTRQDDHWVPLQPPAVQTLETLLRAAPQPLAILGNPLPPIPEPWAGKITILDPALAVGRSEIVWRLGRTLAQQGQFNDPRELLPLYARPPEAQVLWEQRHPAVPASLPKPSYTQSAKP